MLWVPLTLGSALAEAALTVERKRLVTGASAYQLALIQTAMSAVVFGSLLPLTWRGSLSLDIITLIFVRSVSDACATVLMFVAMERDDASRIMPITALTPLFIVGLELAWSGRHPTKMLVGAGDLAFVWRAARARRPSSEGPTWRHAAALVGMHEP